MVKLVGLDVYVQSKTIPDVPKEHGKLALKLISNRGTRVYPGPVPDLMFADVFRCRYESREDVADTDVNDLLKAITESGFVWVQTFKLFARDGENLYSQPY